MLLASLLGLTHLGTHAGQARTSTDQGTISKGKEPAEVLAIVSAMTQEPYYGKHILILEVLKVLGGKGPGNYVRADFPYRAITLDSEEAIAYQRLAKALRLQRVWRIHLRPPRGLDSSGCAWRVPPPLKPGEIAAFEPPPTLIPVAHASGYPDINTLPCYVFEQKDVEEAMPNNF